MHASKPRIQENPRSLFLKLIILFHKIIVIVKGFFLTILVPLYPSDTPNPFKLKSPSALHRERLVAFSKKISLSVVREIQEISSATVNEVFMAVITATIRRYLQIHEPNLINSNPFRLKIHGVLPLSIRSPNQLQLGNQFIFYPVEFPIKFPDRFKMLMESKRISNDMKISPEAPMFMITQKILTSVLPTKWIIKLQYLILNKFTFAFTNVPGTKTIQYLDGIKVNLLIK